MSTIVIDTATRTAVCEPSALNAEVKATRRQGSVVSADPSSFGICGIGGSAATNAGGLCCVKYGVTVDCIALALEVVLADGRAIRLGGKLLKDSAGLPLTNCSSAARTAGHHRGSPSGYCQQPGSQHGHRGQLRQQSVTPARQSSPSPGASVKRCRIHGRGVHQRRWDMRMDLDRSAGRYWWPIRRSG